MEHRMKRKLAVAVFTLFVLTDIILVTAALTGKESAPAPAGFNSPTATPSAAATSAAAKASGPASLNLGTDGLLARLIAGRCAADTAPRLDVSSDGAKTFDEIALPSMAGDPVRTLLGARLDSDSDFTIVAGDRECRAKAFRTKDRGMSWKEVVRPDLWYLDASGTGVSSPTTSSEPGCEGLSVSPFSERNAKVLCANGLIRGTDNSGDDWITLGQLGDATAGTFWDLRQGLAVAPDKDCRSRAFETGDAGLRWSAAGCVAKRADVSSVVGSPTLLYALAGSRVLTSIDGGDTWTTVHD
jgi:hypothetical protein